MNDRNTLSFDAGSTFYVESGGEFIREDRPGSLRRGNVVRIQGVRGIFRVVEIARPRNKLTIEVEKIHGDALFWVRDAKHNVYPVSAVCSPRENDPLGFPITEYLIDGHGWIDAASVTETQDPNLADVSQARSRNRPAMVPV